MLIRRQNRWDSALLKSQRYYLYFEALKLRTKQHPYFLQSYSRDERLTLRWTLQHEHEVIREIVKYLRAYGGNASLSPLKHSLITLDKTRNIYIADWPERILISVMAQVLTEYAQPQISPAVYSFQKGRNASQAIRNLATFIKGLAPEQPLYILKRDISSYGDSIEPDKMMACLGTLAGFNESRIFAPLLKSAMKIEFESNSLSEQTPIQACLVKGIPSGSPLTPPMENLFLSELDSQLTRYPQTFYARYGDDFVFACSERTLAESVEKEIDSIVQGLSLFIKPEKRKNLRLAFSSQDHNTEMGFERALRIEWLGLSVDRAGTIGCKYDHQQRAKHSLIKNVCGLIDTLERLSISNVDNRIKILRSGLRELLSRKNSHLVQSLLYKQDNLKVLSQIDHHLAHTIVRRLCASWRTSRQQAWRIYRNLRVPSLSHERSQLYSRSKELSFK